MWLSDRQLSGCNLRQDNLVLTTMNTNSILISSGVACGLAVGAALLFTDVLGPNPNRYPSLLNAVRPTSALEVKVSPEFPQVVTALAEQMEQLSDRECRSKQSLTTQAFLDASNDLVTQATVLSAGPGAIVLAREILRAAKRAVKVFELGNLEDLESAAEDAEVVERVQKARVEQVENLFLLLRENVVTSFEREGVALRSVGPDMRTLFSEALSGRATNGRFAYVARPTSMTQKERRMYHLDTARQAVSNQFQASAPPRAFTQATQAFRSSVLSYIQKLCLPIDLSIANAARKPIPRVNTN